MNTETSEKLIRYSIKHQHCLKGLRSLEIETTRDIAHQIVRHRSFAFQELAQDMLIPIPMGDTFTTREARLQDAKNRQNSIELDDESDLHYAWREKQREVIHKARSVYEWAIQNGIGRASSVVLPEGNTQTRLYMNGTQEVGSLH